MSGHGRRNAGCRVCADCGARHYRFEPCVTCPLCGCYRIHHHLTSRGFTKWCVATDATWPTDRLLAKAGGVQRLCELLDISHGSIPARLTDSQADRWAIRCGWHPEQVWPGWLDAGLRYVDRVLLDGGWRPAWLHAEPVPAPLGVAS